MKGVVLAAVVCLGVVPQIAQAQACFGVPSVDGQTAVSGFAGFTKGSKQYGADVTANLAGPLSVGANYSLIDIDDYSKKAHSFGAGAAYELKVPSVSVCPTVRANYTRVSLPLVVGGTVTEFAVPVGVGIGKQFAAGENYLLTAFGEPQIIYVRGKTEIAGESVTGSDTAFGANLGVRFGNSSYYVGGGVQFTTFDDSDPVYNVGIGVLVGGKR